MRKKVRNKYSSYVWKDKNEEKRQRQFMLMRDDNKCGNNLWNRKDNKTFVLICKQTGERCNINHCPCFSKQS